MRRIVALLGPTASGKSETAMILAREMGAEILSVDSMQVYRGMDIGTAKPSALERREVVHHMIDVVDPEEEFSVAEFRALGRKAIADSTADILIITGGSGLHFRAIVDPMSFAPTDAKVRRELEEAESEELVSELLIADPSAGEHVDLANARRVIRAVEVFRLTGETPTGRHGSAEADRLRRYESEMAFIGAGIDPGEDLEARATARVGEMRSGGLLDEVAGLADRLGRTASRAVGYRELLPVVEGGADVDDAFERILANTLRLARKQRTWFQRDPRIRWIPWQHDPEQRAKRLFEVVDG